jgi:hypothetical protein
MEIDMANDVITIKSRYGDQRVRSICRKIIDGTYVEHDKLLWMYVHEGRLNPNQFAMIIDAIKQTVKEN